MSRPQLAIAILQIGLTISRAAMRLFTPAQLRLAVSWKPSPVFRRPPPGIIAELQDIEDAETDPPVFGTVPASWLSGHRMGRSTVLRKQCADIYRSEWLSHLRRELEEELSALAASRNSEFDLSDLMSRNRQVSQKRKGLGCAPPNKKELPLTFGRGA